jgi:hypothetical protein
MRGMCLQYIHFTLIIFKSRGYINPDNIDNKELDSKRYINKQNVIRNAGEIGTDDKPYVHEKTEFTAHPSLADCFSSQAI